MKITLDSTQIQKIFILEDNEERIAWFRKVFTKVPSVVITDEVYFAKNELLREKYDLIFLDHDLDDYSIYDESNPDFDPKNTGYEVIKDLRDTVNKETEIIIHSMNPTGAANMVQAHPFNVAHVPFWMLKNSLEVI